MKKLLKLLFVLSAFFVYNTMNAQTTITGGGGNSQVSGNPNSNALLVVSSSDEAKIAVDTTTGKFYVYMGATKPHGSKWQEAKMLGDGYVSNVNFAAGTLTITRTNADGSTTNLTTPISIPTVDGSETKLSNGTNITITGAGTVASPYIINANFTETDGSTTNEIQNLSTGVIAGAYQVLIDKGGTPATIVPAAFYIDDAAAAAGGVPIGGTYKIDVGNSFGYPKGTNRTRIN